MNITIHGTPAPQGSKRHIGHGVMIESSKKLKPWRQDVKYAALTALAEHNTNPPADGPLHVRIEFYLTRPRGHYRTGRNAHLLRDGAPRRPHHKPDLDKLIRSTLDGLGEAGAWTDDAQVTTVVASKWYADQRPPGAAVTIQPEHTRGDTPTERTPA